MPTVAVAKEDVLHPLANCEQVYDNGIQVFVAARVYHVTNLSDGSSDAPKTALYRAVTATGLPKIGDPYPGRPGQLGCICTGVKPIIITESDNDVYIYASYTTPLPSGPTTQASIVSIERDTVLASELAQLHPSDLSPLLVKLPYASTKDQQFRPANIPYNTPLKRLTITASVRQANIDALENAVGTVNDATWQKFPMGYWLYSHFRELTTNQLPIVYLLELEFISRIRRSWLEYDIARSDMLGTRLSVDPGNLAKARNLKYFYGQNKDIPGMLVAGMYPLQSFRQLLGIN